MSSLGKNIYLIGFMGAGKSTIGKLLSKKLGTGYYDTDIEIEYQIGCSITDIISIKGIDRFRIIESEMLKNLSLKQNCIISTGGGMALSDENKNLMKKTGTVIWLKISPQTAKKRLKGDITRPLLKGRSEEELEKLIEIRMPHYEEAAHFSIDVDPLTPSEICKEIFALLEKTKTEGHSS